MPDPIRFFFKFARAKERRGELGHHQSGDLVPLRGIAHRNGSKAGKSEPRVAGGKPAIGASGHCPVKKKEQGSEGQRQIVLVKRRDGAEEIRHIRNPAQRGARDQCGGQEHHRAVDFGTAAVKHSSRDQTAERQHLAEHEREEESRPAKRLVQGRVEVDRQGSNGRPENDDGCRQHGTRWADDHVEPPITNQNEHALDKKQNYPTEHGKAVSHDERDNLLRDFAASQALSMQDKETKSHGRNYQHQAGGGDHVSV
jgi:hypothetical protein